VPTLSTQSKPFSLADELRAIVGEDAVVSKEEELLVYECDAYTLEKNLPTAVVLPRTTEQIKKLYQYLGATQDPFPEVKKVRNRQCQNVTPYLAGHSLASVKLVNNRNRHLLQSRQGRPQIAHGFNRGLRVENGQSPGRRRAEAALWRAAKTSGATEKMGLESVRSFVPYGTRCIITTQPSDESPGFFRPVGLALIPNPVPNPIKPTQTTTPAQ
jgi:hypothetical protein